MKPEATVRRKTPGVIPTMRRTGRDRAARRDADEGLVVPDELVDALRQDGAAAATWRSLAPSHRRDYASWIAEAKRSETRARRVAQAVSMLAAGVRDRNAKYRKS